MYSVPMDHLLCKFFLVLLRFSSEGSLVPEQFWKLRTMRLGRTPGFDGDCTVTRLG